MPSTETQWAIAHEIGAVLHGGDPVRALSMLEERRELLAGPAWYVAVLESQCHDKLGDAMSAVQVLETRTRLSDPEPWVYYHLGSAYQKVGRLADAAIAFREAHERWGWPESKSHRYTFTHDFFAPNIPDWTRWFSEIITQTPIHGLEIGSWQGGSTTWLLDKIVGPRGGTLTCMDTFEGSSEHAGWIGEIDPIEDIFDRNVAATGYGSLATKLKGYSQELLLRMQEMEFDFVYIDGAHEAKYLIQDAILCWRLIKPGGFMLFDDVDFCFEAEPEQDSRNAIDFFTSTFGKEIQPVHDGRQRLIRKKR